FYFAQMYGFNFDSSVFQDGLHRHNTAGTHHIFNEYFHDLSFSLFSINSIWVLPCLVGFPASSTPTNTIFSMVMMVCRVIIFRTSQYNVIEVLPKSTASIPISIISPFFAELTKLISEINLVTHLGVSS